MSITAIMIAEEHFNTALASLNILPDLKFKACMQHKAGSRAFSSKIMAWSHKGAKNDEEAVAAAAAAAAVQQSSSLGCNNADGGC
jgi:mannitol/fructose-specific phosphotransferase system IIA component (Ntr-type)